MSTGFLFALAALSVAAVLTSAQRALPSGMLGCAAVPAIEGLLALKTRFVECHWGVPVSYFPLMSLVPMAVPHVSTNPDVVKCAIFFCGIRQEARRCFDLIRVSGLLSKRSSLQRGLAASIATGIIRGVWCSCWAGQYTLDMLSDRLGGKSVSPYFDSAKGFGTFVQPES